MQGPPRGSPPAPDTMPGTSRPENCREAGASAPRARPWGGCWRARGIRGGSRPPPQQLWVSAAPRSRTQRPHRGRTRTRAVEGPCGRSQVGQQAGSRAAGRPRREQCGGQGAADLSARGSLSSGAPFPSLDGALTQRCCWGAERGPGNPTPLAPGQCS